MDLRYLFSAYFVYALSFSAVGFSSTFYFLLISFLFFGIAFSVFQPIAFALISRWTEKSQRGKIMGNFTAAGDIGRFAFSVATPFLVSSFGKLLITQLLSLLPLIVFAYLFKRHLPKEHLEHEERKAVQLGTNYKEFLHNKSFLLQTFSAGLDCIASSAVFVFLPFLFLYRGVDAALIGVFAGVFFIGSFLGKRFFGKLSDKHGDKKLFIITEILMAIILVALSFATNVALIIALTLIVGIMTKGTVPTSLSMLSKVLDKHTQPEKGYGLNGTFINITRTATPVLLGFISLHFGITNAFIACAVFALLAIIPTVFIPREILLARN